MFDILETMDVFLKSIVNYLRLNPNQEVLNTKIEDCVVLYLFLIF